MSIVALEMTDITSVQRNDKTGRLYEGKGGSRLEHERMTSYKPIIPSVWCQGVNKATQLEEGGSQGHSARGRG